jgi:hypothetical protein
MNSLILLAAAIITKKDLEDANIPVNDVTGNNVNNILQVVFGTMGAIALIIIIIAGIKFMTSQGNPDNLTKARNTIIYAAVGLAVSLGALTIVTFVVGRL